MNWIKQLSVSERKLLKIGAWSIIVAICWAFIYQPLNKSLHTKQIKKLELNQQYQQMLKLKDVITNQKSSNTSMQIDLNKPFITWVDEQLEKQQLSQYVTRSEPKDNHTLILTFESIVFDKLIQWLEPLESSYGVIISEVDINLLNRSTGLCNARLTLEQR
jgi:type II secretory pathway component PulM